MRRPRADLRRGIGRPPSAPLGSRLASLLARDTASRAAAAAVLIATSCANQMSSCGDNAAALSPPDAAPAASSQQTDGLNAANATPGMCENPTIVGLGQSLTGTTCGGEPRPLGESICEAQGHPVVYVRADAPPGAAIRITSTAKLALLGFEDCAHPPKECTAFGTTLAPSDSNLRLFGIEHDDVPCGAFTISVVKP